SSTASIQKKSQTCGGHPRPKAPIWFELWELRFFDDFRSFLLGSSLFQLEFFCILGFLSHLHYLPKRHREVIGHQTTLIASGDVAGWRIVQTWTDGSPAILSLGHVVQASIQIFDV